MSQKKVGVGDRSVAVAPANERLEAVTPLSKEGRVESRWLLGRACAAQAWLRFQDVDDLKAGALVSAPHQLHHEV